MITRFASRLLASSTQPARTLIDAQLATLLSVNKPMDVVDVASQLTNEALEQLDQLDTTLIQHMRTRPDVYALRKCPEGVFATLVEGGAEPEVQQLIAALRASVPSTHFVRADELTLDPAMKDVMRRRFGCVQRFAARYPKLLFVSACCKWVTRVADDGLLHAPLPRGQKENEAQVLEAPQASLWNDSQQGQYDPILDQLAPYLPSNFVPLTEILRVVPQTVQDAYLKKKSLFEQLQALSADDIDIRMFGEEPDQIFVRLIGENVLSNVDDFNADEQFYSDYCIDALEKDLHAAIQALPDARVRADQLKEVLPVPLFRKLPITNGSGHSHL